jgi:hypothetical protein
MEGRAIMNEEMAMMNEEMAIMNENKAIMNEKDRHRTRHSRQKPCAALTLSAASRAPFREFRSPADPANSVFFVFGLYNCKASLTIIKSNT